MGNVSSTTQQIMSIVENTTKSACRTSQATDQSMRVMLDLEDVNCPNIDFVNTSKQESTCEMGSIAESLAEASMAMSKEQTAGLPVGINADHTVQERTAIIKQYLEQECEGNQAIRQRMNVALRAKNMSCDQLRFHQNADLTTKCIINAAISAVTKDDQKGDVKQTADLLGPLTSALTAMIGAPFLILGSIILAIGLLFLVFRLFRGRATGADAAGTQALLPSEQAQVDAAVNRVAQRAAAPTVGERAEAASRVLDSAAPIATAAISALTGRKKKT